MFFIRRLPLIFPWEFCSPRRCGAPNRPRQQPSRSLGS